MLNITVFVIGSCVKVIPGCEQNNVAKLHTMSSASKLDLINQALTRGYSPDLRLENLLQTVLDTFGADRAWLLYPCDPQATTYRIPKEVTTAQYPGASSENLALPLTPLVKQLMSEALCSDNAIIFAQGHPLLSELNQFSVQSQLAIKIDAATGSPWIFGLHQCAYPRIWKDEDINLFKNISHRISDTLSNYLLFYELEQSEDQYRTLFEFSHDGLVIANANQKILAANKSFCRLTRTEQNSVVNSPFLENFHPDSISFLKAKFGEVFAGKNCQCEARFQAIDASVIDFDLHASLINYQGQKAALISIRDISSRKIAERQQQYALSVQLAIMEATEDAILITDGKNRVINYNQNFLAICNAPQHILQTHEVARFQEWIIKQLESSDPSIMPDWTTDALSKKPKPSVLKMTNGNIFEFCSNPFAIDESIEGYVLRFRDITDHFNLTEKLNYQASHDPLTQLLNRRHFELCIQQALENLAQKNITHVLCYLDLDQFKIVNDTCGHVAGDELLKQLSGMMLCLIRQQDTLARLGGDEFGLLLSHCSINQATRIIHKIREEIARFVFCWDNRPFNIGVSIGLVEINEHNRTIGNLLIDADTACYLAKQAGRNCIHIHQPDNEQVVQIHSQMQYVNLIQQALEHNTFALWAQRIIPLQADEPRLHLEILLRLPSASGQIITPGAILPTAERYHLMPQIDHWVISHTLRWFSNHPDTLNQLDVISINLSGQSLTTPSLFDLIDQACHKYDFPRGKLCFEITETVAISNLNQAKKLISLLKQTGCRFSLDDFGSGLSSFAYLKNLPVDYLKIDGQFIREIVDDPIDFAMVKSINEIGRVISKLTIAEYVETPEILEKLQHLGVDYAQGFYTGKPIPLEQHFN